MVRGCDQDREGHETASEQRLHAASIGSVLRWLNPYLRLLIERAGALSSRAGCAGIRRTAPSRGEPHAEQERERQEREAVRRAEEEGHVEGAGGEDRELAWRVQPRRQGVGLGQLQLELEAGRYERAEEGRRSQGRQGRREEELTSASTLNGGTH